MTQDDPWMTQDDPWITQDDPQVTQDDPMVTQDDLRMTQEDPRAGVHIIGNSVQIHYAIIQLIIRKISKLSSSFAKFENPWSIRKIGS